MIKSEQLTRILLEVAINRTTKSPQDSPEEAEMRRQFVAECDAIRDAGGVVDIPGEFE